MFTKVCPRIYIGNYDSIDAVRTAMQQYELGVDHPISEVTAVLNVSTIPYEVSAKPIPQTRYMPCPISSTEPSEYEISSIVARYVPAVQIVFEAVRNGHTILIVCESGRKQSAVLAVMAMKSLGADLNPAMEQVEYAHMLADEKKEYLRIMGLREMHKFDDEFQLSERDQMIFTRLTDEKLCLSTAFKKMLLNQD